MSRLLAILGVLGVLTLLTAGACGAPAERMTVCGTQDRPPVVVADERCPGPGVQVYSAPVGDVDEDDWPIEGQPLDGDFWNLADQMDLDESHRSGHRYARPYGSPRISVSRTPRSSVAAVVPTTPRTAAVPTAKPTTANPAKTSTSKPTTKR